jgi:NADPH-dependent curcumin reductase CurA
LISQYDTTSGALGSGGNLVNLGAMIYPQLRIEGFVASPYIVSGEYLPAMAKWLKEGVYVQEHTFFDGIESWPEAFCNGVMQGKHMGKVVVRL